MVLKDKGGIAVLYTLTVILSFFLGRCNDRRQSSDGISIQWQDSTATALIIPLDQLGDIPEDSAARLITIHLADHGLQPPVFGDYRVAQSFVVFEPIIPFTRGLYYEVRFRDRILETVRIPSADPSLGPRVVAVYPGNDTVPENLLKLYLQFSKPMQESDPLQYVQLLQGSDTLSRVFLDLRPALWNKDGTVLTLWFEPGRIKRDLQPNKSLGTPLEEGKSYRLVVRPDWPGRDGAHLIHGFEKIFTAGPRDSISPSVHAWRIQTPSPRTHHPLKIFLRETMDFLLMEETINVVNSAGKPVKGEMTITDEETVISFIPQDPWQEGSYSLLSDARLEDLAGNNLNRLFDEDRTVKKTGSPRDLHEVAFKIK